MKIVYVYATIATIGGTERMITEKANYMTNVFGYDVTIINCFQQPDENNAFPLSDKVKQINLGISYLYQYQYKYPKRLWIKFQIARQLRKEISKTVKEADPDILISVSRFKADIISAIKCRAKKITECHEVRYNTLYAPGLSKPFHIRVFMKIHEYIYFKSIEKHADVIVTLTSKDKELWKRAKRVEVIPNFSIMPVVKYSDCTAKRIISVGRFEWEKGFGRLIEIWKYVYAKHPDWHLDIFGEGPMLNTLKTLMNIYKSKNIIIHPFTTNISLEYTNSSICVVTSYYEGFSLVILEALKHGVPCIAYNCPFGPESLIEDARNGFLVEDSDTRLFAERICRLIEDYELRTHFSQAGIDKSKQYNVKNIMNQWKSLFET